ncbi:phage portal protein [Streptomyces sp. NBC_00996]|uniref:phage portal protein n=1 Tax=Streptomyces sp. NBC_00996 TaxID=2903710 RepID=UPI0038647DB5|nr:phage portal protein [Streptomyces sp. NBC_00996]
MGLLDRVNAALAPQQRDAPLGLDQWAQLFSFGGTSYPLVQTTMSTIDEEQIAFTASAAYKSNGPVFSLVVARLQVFSQARFQWTRFNGGQPGQLFGNPELGVLERPWPGGTTGDLLARMEVDASLAGNSYIRRTRADRLNRLRPDWVIVVLGSKEMADFPSQAADVEVVGHVYDPPSGPMQFFPIDGSKGRIAHYAPLPDPDFHFLGQSWITPVLREMQADSLATEHKARFYTNAATPNLAIKFDPSVTLAQVKEFKELMESEHQGAWNAYKTLYLGGGADPKVIGKDFKELDFAATQGKGESRLAAAAGVPPSWVGFSEGLQGSSLNAGNFTAARRRFADGTMQHLWSNAASSLEALLTPPDSGTALWFDTKSVAFMREDAGDLARIQQEQAQTIAALVRDGFTAKSAVDALINNDWTRLVHTGLTSVQLQPPSDGQEPIPTENTTPEGVNP